MSLGYSRYTELLIAEFFGSLAFFFLMAAMYEGLKYFREILQNFAMEKRKERKNKVDSVNGVRIDERYVASWCDAPTDLWMLVWV